MKRNNMDFSNPKWIWTISKLLWFATFLIVSFIIFILLKIFLNISYEVTYLQVCIVHFIWRILKVDLPTQLIPEYYQQQKMSEVQGYMDNLQKELEKIENIS